MLPVRSYLELLSSNLGGLGRRVAVLAVALVVGIALQLVNPQLLRQIIDGALAGEPSDVLVPVAALFVGLALAAQVVTVATTWVAEDVGWRATNRLRADLTSHVLHLDLGFHAHHSPGELIERIDGDVTALSNFFSALVVKVVGNGLLLVGVVALVARESLLLGGVLGGLLVAGVAAFGRLHGVVVPWWERLSETSAEVYGHVAEHVGGTEDVVPNGAVGFVQERFADRLRTFVPRMVTAWSGYAVMWTSGEVLSTLTKLAVYVIGAVQLATGRMTVGSVFLVAYYELMLGRPLHQLREEFADLQKAGGAIVRIEQLRSSVPSMAPPGGRSVPRGPLELSLDRVGFTYADEVDALPVLHGVDLTVTAGRTLGIVGRTGSGKSTLAKLAVRLHESTEGTVRLAGVPIGEVDDLRDRVGMVTQQVQLFRATVRDNLTFFDDDVPDGRLHEVLDDLALTSWLAGLPDGLDTVLDGNDLSAGQAQLLAFARIFLRDPGLVVLDEASSRLDPVTEALLERAVDRLLADRTGIVIAHRLATLDRVDDVLVLEDGHVVEHGPRDALAADPTSRFARLLATGMEEVLE